MRILLACEFYFPSSGGVQEVVRQLAERLVERGHHVRVATSFLPQRAAREINGVEIVEFKASGNLARGLGGEVEAYRQLVLRGDYDVFMVKAAQQWTFDALLPVLERLHRPKVFIPCGFSGLLEPGYADYYRAMPAALRAFDHLIFYATDYRDIEFARSHGLANFSIIPNGASEREFGVPADPHFRQRHGIAQDAFVVLTVGTLSGARKGHRELTEAFALASFGAQEAVLLLNGNTVPRMRAQRSPSQLLRALLFFLQGRGALRRALALIGQRLRQAAARWLPAGPAGAQALTRLIERVNRAAPAKRALLTDLPREELVQAYLNSDLFVFASQVEYSPLVLFESAAAGLAFLSVPVGNAEEIARWTGGGEICPASQDGHGYTIVDPVVLAAHLGRLAADPQRRAALGASGRHTWAEKYTWEKIADHYEVLFARIAARAGR